MADWRFDEARFVEEVLKPVTAGWSPADDLFRVYLLLDSVSDPAVIASALEGVQRELSTPRLQRSWGRAVHRLRSGHQAAADVLTSEPSRRAHGAAVRARRARLQESITDRLAGGPGLPPETVTAIAAGSRGHHTRTEIRRMLAELGASQKDPVELPVVASPPQWSQLQGALRELDQAGLWSYLASSPPLTGQATTLEQLRRRRDEEVAKRRDHAAAVEGSVIEFVRALLSAGRLQDALRFELLDELAAFTAYRYPNVVDAARAAADRLHALGLPRDPEAVAYAVWCRRRFAEAEQGTGWKVAVREALAGKDLRRAVIALSSAGALPAEDRTRLAQLQARIAELDGELARAAGLESSDPETAAQAYLAVRAELHDPVLDAGLARCRPAAVARVGAELDGERVVVSWPPSPARAGRISYIVVRGSGHRPVQPQDGAVIATDLPDARVLDVAAPAGQQVHYAVFTVREGGAMSAPTLSAPVLLLREVADLRLEPAADAVCARWRPPDGAAGVHVSRRPGRSGADAVELAEVRSSGFTDRDVRPGQRYEYRVRVRYRLPDGSAARTPGLLLDGACQQIPQPVTDLLARLDGEDVVLTWTPPERGEVEVRDLGGAPVPRQGVLPLSAVEGIGRPLPGGLRSRGELRARPPAGARRMTLLPVTVLGALAAVGAARVVDRRQRAVQGLRAVRHGSVVQLTWAWPDGVSEARVLYSRERPPAGPQDEGATWRDVTRVGYDTAGVRLELPAGRYHLAVCTVVTSDGEQAFGPLVGVVETAVREVPYRIGRPAWTARWSGGWRARHRRTVSAGSHDGPPLPAMVLVARARTRPMQPWDAQEVLRFEGGSPVLARDFELPVGLARPVHLRMFSLDPAAVLVPERSDRLVVG